jgi:hypothetical protein
MAYTTIDDSEAHFQAVLYTGNGSGDHAITLPGDTDMQPSMIWIKERTSTSDHFLTDVGLGVGGGGTPTRLEPSANSAESPQAFTVQSDGFTLVTTTNQVNQDGITHVAWCWKESADAGFDIVTYTGTGSAKTESHSLSAVPHLMIVKNRTDADAWRVYHHKNTSAPETDYLVLDTTAATADDATAWNDTAPTSSVFSVGTSDETNENTDSFIAYLFSEKQGFSKFGSYTGNGNADGAFVYTGFRPAYLLLRESSAAGEDWIVQDNKRDTFNPVDFTLYASASNAENSGYRYCDFNANGFKIRNALDDYNTSDSTYIYIAFAEAPFVNSNGVPGNAR